jgi:hypothetical protein
MTIHVNRGGGSGTAGPRIDPRGGGVKVEGIRVSEPIAVLPDTGSIQRFSMKSIGKEWP